MAMESFNDLESVAVPSNGECSPADGPMHLGINNVKDNEHLGDLLNDFESYWEDINERLIISRAVSDSVIKGMAEEAAEMITAKELQVTGLKEQLLEGQTVQHLQEELEVIVMQNAIHDLRGECERRLLDSQFCGNKMIHWRDNLKLVSSICQDLDAFQKSLSSLERLSTHGSLESDHFHRKVLTNNVFTSSLETSSRDEESNVNLPENFESYCLKCMSPAELYSHLRDMIIKLKREHESNVQAMTEAYFSLKREFLKERELLKEKGSFLPLKSKDFDILRKRISDTISKLNEIVLENEDFSKIYDHSREQYNSLKEVKCLSSQVSVAEEKLTQQLLDKASLSRKIEDLKKSLEDARVEASASDELYKCIIRDLVYHIKSEEEENHMKSIIMQDALEIIYGKAFCATEAKMISEFGEFSNMQAIMEHEISGVLFQEVLRDMETQLKKLKEKYSEQHEFIVSLESKASVMERSLSLEVVERHKLEQKILELEALVEEKNKLLTTEKEEFQNGLNKKLDLMAGQEVIIFQRNNELENLKVKLEELENLKVKLEESLHQIDLYKDQRDKLTEKLELTERESRATVIQERKNADSLVDAKDRKFKEQIRLVVHVVQELMKTFADFELKTAQSINSSNLRLENFTFQLDSLIKKANLIRKTGLVYKKRLERRCSDLQKAEAEVDLLGDEVETLLSLLEKIYIALDHYSPILQHYPGIMEILKLVQTELHSDSSKSVCQAT